MKLTALPYDALKKFQFTLPAKNFLQLCDGLGELHMHKIIHRDIKPSNLILQGDRIRLIDFDAARIFKPDKPTNATIFFRRA